MKALAVLALWLITASLAFGFDERPNIILFVSDDQRADVLGCAGHPIVRTPSVDGLARDGVRFSNAFVTTSICAASRATILTGVVERTHRYTFGTPPLARRFGEASYPHRLRAAGYHTGFVGKFGVSVAGGAETIAGMFDTFVPVARTPAMTTREDGSTRHFTDRIGDEAVAFIRVAPADRPFCLSVSFHAAHAEDGDLQTHYPHAPAEAGLYTQVPMPRPRLDGEAVHAVHPPFLRESLNRRRFFWRWDTPEKYDRNLRNYFRMLSGLDRNIGRVMAELEASKLASNTVIIFTSDNGYFMGERGFAGKWSHY
ncbi:MAG: sulfatase-like hydrolase/transferase, partial [Phycisphaerales bacterium]|nr:sulfatase-like hydrolase/transferase [Phycisphaerales bacterium]